MYQPLHEQRIAWGYVSRRDPTAMEFLSTTPPFDLFLDPSLIEMDGISPDEIQSSVETLRDLNFRYILIIKQKRYSNLRRLGRPGSVLNLLRVGFTPYSLNTELQKALVEIEKSRSDIKTTDEETARFRDFLGLLLGDCIYEDDEVIAYRVPDK